MQPLCKFFEVPLNNLFEFDEYGRPTAVKSPFDVGQASNSQSQDQLPDHGDTDDLMETHDISQQEILFQR